MTEGNTRVIWWRIPTPLMFTTAKFVDNRIQWKGQKDFGDAQIGLHYKVGRFPLWLEKEAKRLAKTVLQEESDSHGSLQALINEYNNPFGWFDHAGLLRLDPMKTMDFAEDPQVLVVEPYGIWHDCLSEIMRFASDLNLRVQIEAAGSWYPTHTVRILFYKRL